MKAAAWPLSWAVRSYHGWVHHRHVTVVLLLLLVTAAGACGHKGGEGPAPEVRKVVLIQGIDSRSGCDDQLSNTSSFLARRQAVFDAVAPHGARPQDVVGFSYSGGYEDCGSETKFRFTSAPSASAVPSYSPRDTCTGVIEAAGRLESLLASIAKKEPGARFALVAHSMGGLVASAYVARANAAFVSDHVSDVILLDSPVLGLTAMSPITACTKDDASWRDLFAGSEVIGAISGAACKYPGVRFQAVLATEIGASLDCARTSRTVSYGAPAPPSESNEACTRLPEALVALCLANGAVLAETLHVSRAHSRVWLDPNALKAIADAYASR
ncbi:MAG TPA: alpha/beta hydrolase [Dehalococcoidia bacterium]|nr:alpha/beta hydrolase [Dehalococcoidia bacterium]